MEDRSKLFQDIGFKLVVIDSLLKKNPSFIEEYKSVPQEKREAFLENILLTDADMDKVDSIVFSNSLSIYSYLGKVVEVKNIDDIDLLYNLKSIGYQ